MKLGHPQHIIRAVYNINRPFAGLFGQYALKCEGPEGGRGNFYRHTGLFYSLVTPDMIDFDGIAVFAHHGAPAVNPVQAVFENAVHPDRHPFLNLRRKLDIQLDLIRTGGFFRAGLVLLRKRDREKKQDIQRKKHPQKIFHP